LQALEQTDIPAPAHADAAGRGWSLRSLFRGHAAFWLILVAATLIRAVCVEAKGYEFDMFMFRDWAVIIHDRGMGAVLHAPDQDYIGYHYVLWVVVELYAPIAGHGWRNEYLFLHILKIPGTIADLGVVALIYVITTNFFRAHTEMIPASLTKLTATLPGFGREPAIDMAILACALYAFNPGVIYATSYWGQLDSFPTFFMLAALAAMTSKRVPLAWALLAAGFVLKPQAVVLFPLLGVMTLRERGVQGLVKGGVATLLVMTAGYFYFAAIGEIDTVFRIYRGIFTDDTMRVSTSAWNFWWPVRVFEDPMPTDTLLNIGRLDVSYTLVSQLLTGLSGLLMLLYAWRAKSPLHAYVAASFLAFSFFMLPMKIHERYLFPFFALMAPLAVQNRSAFLLYLALTVTFASNLFGVYQVFYGEFFKQRDIALICTAVNATCYVLFTASLIGQLNLPKGLRDFRPSRTRTRGDESSPLAGSGVSAVQSEEAGIAPASHIPQP
jgi:Gpi18-like mannosyltransferase